MSYDEFEELHRTQLVACGLPPSLWREAHRKLSEEVFDAGEFLQVVYVAEEEDDDEGGEQDAEAKEDAPKLSASGYRVRATQPITANSHVFLVDHAWSTTWAQARDQLRMIPGLVDRLLTMFDLPTPADVLQALREQPPDRYRAPEPLVERVWLEMWRYNGAYRVAGPAGELASEPTWYVMDELGSWIRHRSQGPTFAVTVVFFRGAFFSLLWPTADLAEGEEATRDFQPGVTDPLRRPARLFPWADAPARWAEAEELRALREALAGSFAAAGGAQKASEGRDPEPPEGGEAALARRRQEAAAALQTLPRAPSRRPLRVATDVPTVRRSLSRPEFAIVDDAAEADVLWVMANVRDWSSVPPSVLIAQFPGEGHVVEKQRLAELCQGYYGRPRWLPRTYNLEKEASELIAVFVLRQAEGFDNTWIVKPWRLARSMETCVTRHLLALLRLAETGPKVACKYIERPALLDGCKFDLRFIVAVRSTAPLVLYAYARFWIRSANEPFALDDFETYQKHFTVMNYGAGAMKQIAMEEFVPKFLAQNGVAAWGPTLDAIHAMLRKPFAAAAATGVMPGHAAGRAVYGADVMLGAGGEPYLLEVTYQPDCTRAETYYPGFHDSLLAALLLDDVNPADWLPL